MSGEELNNLVDSLKQQMQGEIDTISASLLNLEQRRVKTLKI